MFEPKIRNSQTDLLMKAILTLESEEDAYRFFEDICTIPEIKSISQRLEVAFVPALHTLGSIRKRQARPAPPSPGSTALFHTERTATAVFLMQWERKNKHGSDSIKP